MKNYYNYDIDAVENGFTLSATYKVTPKDKDDYFTTRNDKFVFTNFDQVIDYMKSNPLVSPPVKN